MARRGVPQDEVFQAADALLADGERPTVERVRGALGRGSPNALAPVLESWWAQLAQRLTQVQGLPSVPTPVGEAFAHAWHTALEAGRAHGEALVAPERAAVADVLAKAEAASAEERAQRARLETQLLRSQGEATAYQSALAISEQRNSDLLRERADQQAELQALSVRLDATLARHHLVVQQAEDARTAAATEREALRTHVVQVEDRAHAEIDRLRQEARALKAEAATQSRHHATALRDAQRAMHVAQREASAQAARAETLGAQLKRLTQPAKARPVATAKRVPQAPRVRSTK
ncbi:MAG TPA: DNA-binding protein [Verrucomicrobiae bacterium]|nr:DNA-binding protein [Verrucomicrobiae bacterium]